jgi:hypothetical protein
MHADIFIGVVYYQRLRHMVRMDDHSVALSYLYAVLALLALNSFTCPQFFSRCLLLVYSFPFLPSNRTIIFCVLRYYFLLTSGQRQEPSARDWAHQLLDKAAHQRAEKARRNSLGGNGERCFARAWVVVLAHGPPLQLQVKDKGTHLSLKLLHRGTGPSICSRVQFFLSVFLLTIST